METQIESKLCRVQTILTPQLVQRLDKAADRKTTSRSLLIRQACEAFLRQDEAKEAA